MTVRRIFFAIVFAAIPLSAAQAAQYIVAEARGIGLKVGAQIDPTKPLILKQGQHLTLISMDNGQTIKLDGPYEKAPAAEQGLQLASVFSGLVTKGQSSTTTGVTRGVNAVKLPSAWVLDATQSGTVCLQEGQRPVLWRPVATVTAAVSIMPVDRSWKAQANWPAGDEQLLLTNDLGVHGNASYFIALNGSETTLTIDSIPAALSNENARAAWMIQKGCDRQVEALLRASK